MDIDRIPDEDNTDQPREPLPRRSFLRRAAAGLLGGAVVTFGLTRPSSASGQSVGVGHGGGTQSLNHVYCCQLAYYTYCTSSQISNCSNRWSWTCCAYVGSFLQRVTCGECYSAHCSWTRIGPSC
jgi:hypothetical protein